MRRANLRIKVLVGGAVTAALFGVVLFQLQQAHADDATHTTSLQFGSAAFRSNPAYPNPVPAILASLNSTDPADVTWSITFFATRPGQTETQLSKTVGREVGPSGFSSNRTYGELPSGTQVRALFETKDSGGNVLFSYNRYLTIP